MNRTRTALVASILSMLSVGFLALPAAAEAPQAMPSALRYTVAPGDFLAGVAKKLGVALPDLLDVNQLTVKSVIHPGQALVVPVGGTLPVSATNPTVAAPYVVVTGDYLAGIAKKLGVTLPSLLSTNKLTATSLIKPGYKLTVPAGGTLPVTTPVAPTVESQSVVPPSAGAPNTTYTVVSGDYLVGIAAKHGVTLKALLTANKLIVTSSIQPGRVLNVPPATLPIPAATPAATPTAPAVDTAAVDASAAAYQQKITTVITFLQAQIGKPYVFNTAGPDTYDCSGLVSAAYDQIGISLPHQSLLQSMKGTAVDWRTTDLLPGDLIFQFSTANPTVISHVGIAIDATHWIQAARSGEPVKVGSVPIDDKIQAVRRIVLP